MMWDYSCVRSVNALQHPLTGYRINEGGKKKNPTFPVAPFSPRANVRAEQANESDERSLAGALNVAVSHRSLPLSDADREAF